MTKHTKKEDILLSIIDCELDRIEDILRHKHYPRSFAGLHYRWTLEKDLRHAVRIEYTSIADSKYFTAPTVIEAINKAVEYVDGLPDYRNDEDFRRTREIQRIIKQAEELGLVIVEPKDKAA